MELINSQPGRKERTDYQNQNGGGAIITDPTDIERIKQHYEQIYAKRFDSLDEMDKFLEKNEIYPERRKMEQKF